jgi:hypothetical protein
MLLNSQNQIVNPPKEQNTKSHPSVFIPLREVLEPSAKHHKGFFTLDSRAKVKQ